MDGKEFYNNMYLDHPDRWEVPDGGHHGFDLNIRDIIYKIGNTERPKYHLIDLGCGTGRTLELIKYPNIDMTGIDYSEEAVKIAKKRCPYAQIELCDMNCTDFIDGAFDIVLSVGSHEHQETLDFSEVRRLVNNDGWFIAVFPCINPVSKGRTIGIDGQHYDWDLNKEDWIHAVEPFRFKFIEYKEPWTFVFKPV